ncbi:MAG: hypothetical protein ACFFF9_01755 [Candidatus Thorarchaeota archaeon]
MNTPQMFNVKSTHYRRIKTYNQTEYLTIAQGVSIIRRSHWFPVLLAIIIPLLYVSMTSDFVTADDEIQVFRGSTIRIQVTILQNGSYGEPVLNQPIYYFDQTYNMYLGFSISDQYGITWIDWEIPLNHPLGLTVLNATFYGNATFSLAPSFQQVTISVGARTHLEIDQIPTELSLGDVLSFDVRLEDDMNISLQNQILEVTLDDSHLSFITTNSSGMAHFNTIIDERFSLGIQSLKINYAGSQNYSESSFEVFTEISSPISIAVLISDTAVIGSNLLIEATITDFLNRSLLDSTLHFTDTTSNHSFSVRVDDEEKVTFQYLIQGPPGLHQIVIDILDNPFISNNQYTLNFTAWSKSEIVLVNSNVEHYASPSQEVTLEVRLTDWYGNGSLKDLHLFIDSEAQISRTTNSEGLAIFSFKASMIESQYNISIFYAGNTSRFELPTNYNYILFVTTLMPITINLDSYEIVAPLHQISIQLIVKGFNGTLLRGVWVNFNWLSSNFNAESTERGLIVLQIAIPPVSGSYYLDYESKPTSFVDTTSGSILIEVESSDISSIEGVGITGMIFALCASIGLIAVPVIRRRYLVG